MENDRNVRFTELWESFKQVQGVTEGLEVGSGRFVLIPPRTVRLSGFRARLARSPDGPSAVVIADAIAIVLELHAPDGTLARNELITLDLSDGWVIDGQPMKHASDLAQELVDRMKAVLDRAASPRLQPHVQNGAHGQQVSRQHQESSLER